MGRTPLISAIVSTYRAERFIEGCLDDLLAQDVEDLEIIVVDSASPEAEGEIVRRYQKDHPNIHYTKTAQRETVYAAWNRGIEMAKGRYVTNANTDDRHHSSAFRRLTDELEKRPACAIAWADSAITLVPNQRFDDADPLRIFRWPSYDRRLLFEANYVGPHPVWRRAVHQRHGFFDPRFVVRRRLRVLAAHIGSRRIHPRSGITRPLLARPKQCRKQQSSHQ